MPRKDVIRKNTERAMKHYIRFTGPVTTTESIDSFEDKSFVDIKYDIPEGLDEKTCRLIVLGSLLEEAKAIKPPQGSSEQFGMSSFGRTMFIDNVFSETGDLREGPMGMGKLVKNARIKAKDAIESFKTDPSKAVKLVENATKEMIAETSSARPFQNLSDFEIRLETICSECKSVLSTKPFINEIKLSTTERYKLDTYAKAAPVSAEFAKSYVPTPEEFEAEKDYHIQRGLISQNLVFYEIAEYNRQTSELADQNEKDEIREFSEKYPEVIKELAPTQEEKDKLTWRKIVSQKQELAQEIYDKYQKKYTEQLENMSSMISPMEEYIHSTINSERLSDIMHSQVVQTQVYKNTKSMSEIDGYRGNDPRAVEMRKAFSTKENQTEKNINDAMFGYYSFTAPTINLRENNHFNNKDFLNVTYEIPEGLDKETCSMIVLGAMLEEDRLRAINSSSTGAASSGQVSMSRTFVLDNIFSTGGDEREDEYSGLISSARIDAKKAIENFKNDPSKAMHYIENAARNLILENSATGVLPSFAEANMRESLLCEKCSNIISKEPFKSGVKLEKDELKRLGNFAKGAKIVSEYANYMPSEKEIRANKDQCLRKMILNKGLPLFFDSLNEERRKAEEKKLEEAAKPNIVKKILKEYKEEAEDILEDLKPGKKSLDELSWEDIVHTPTLGARCQLELAGAVAIKLAEYGNEQSPTEELLDKIDSQEEFTNQLYAKVAQTEIYKKYRDMTPEQMIEEMKDKDSLLRGRVLSGDYKADFNSVFVKNMTFKQYAVDQHIQPLNEMSEIFSGTEGLFHGRSEQYRTMTERLKEFTELSKKMGDNPSHPDLLKYQAKMEGLLESVNAYVSYKEPQNDTGRTGTKRLETAKKLQEYLKREVPAFKKNLQVNDDMIVARQNDEIKKQAIEEYNEKTAHYEKASGWRESTVERLVGVMGPHFNPSREIVDNKVFNTDKIRAKELGADVKYDPLTDYKLPENCKYTEHEAAVIALACYCRPDTAGSHEHIQGQSPEERIDGNFTFAVEAFVSSYRQNVGSTLHEGLDKARSMVPKMVEDTPALAEQLAKAIKVTGANVCSRESLSPTVLGYAQISKELIGLVDNHPELMKEITEKKLLTTEELDNCRAYGNLADIMDNKAKSEEKLFKCSLGEMELSPEEVKDCITSIALFDSINSRHGKIYKENENTSEYKAKVEQTQKDIKEAVTKFAGDPKAIENAQFKAQSDLSQYMKSLPPSKAITTLSKDNIEKESRKIRENIDSSILSGKRGPEIWERYKKNELYKAMSTPKSSVSTMQKQNINEKSGVKSEKDVKVK